MPIDTRDHYSMDLSSSVSKNHRFQYNDKKTNIKKGVKKEVEKKQTNKISNNKFRKPLNILKRVGKAVFGLALMPISAIFDVISIPFFYILNSSEEGGEKPPYFLLTKNCWKYLLKGKKIPNAL